MQSIYHRLLFFQKLTTTSAQCGGNAEKNRYKDVVPYEVRFTVCDFGISFLTFKVSDKYFVICFMESTRYCDMEIEKYNWISLLFYYVSAV